MLLCVSSKGVAAVVFPVAETAVPVKVFTSPVGSMTSKAIRSTTSTTNGMTMRFEILQMPCGDVARWWASESMQDPEVAVIVFAGRPRSGIVSKNEEILESISSTDPATVIFPSAETTEANAKCRDSACSLTGWLPVCPLTALSVSQSLLCAVFMADLISTVGVEFARKLHAGFMADPTFPVSVDFFSGICKQSSWLIPRSL